MKEKKNSNNMYTISVISKIISVGLAFINSIIINRYLGPSLKGQYTYIFNIVSILSIIIGFNIASSYPYFSKKFGKEVKQKFINIIYYQTIIYFFILFIFSFFIKEKMFLIIMFISTLFQFNNQITFMSIIIDINRRNIISIIASFSYTLLLIIIYITSKNSIFLIIFAQVFFSIINLILLISINKIYPKIGCFNIVRSKNLKEFITVREIISFSFFPMITTLLTTFNYNLDVIIMKIFVSNNEIGIYSVGVTLAAMLWIIPDAFKDVLFNKTAKDDSIKDIIFSLKVNIYISVFIIIIFLFLGKIFIEIAYGKDFIYSYYVSIILFIGTIPMIFFKIINTLYISIGKQMYCFYVLLLSVVVNIACNFILIPFIGIIGAALSSVLSYLISGIIILKSFENNYKVKLSDIFIFTTNEKKQLYLKFNKLFKKL